MQIATHAGTKAILERYGHRARKSLGQHFLIDPHVLQKIIRCADIGPQDAVLEIGPGIGGLTQALAAAGAHVCAVELDKALADILREIFAETPNVEIVQSDILAYDIQGYLRRTAKNSTNPPKVVANLPYYVTTPIVMHLLENFRFAALTVMVQREVAERMAARPGTKDYGALTLAVQYYCDAYIAAYVPPNCFLPRPQIGSAVIHLTVLPKPRVDVDAGLLFALIRAGFGQRRKTLANSLSAISDLPKADLYSLITRLGFPETVRGEALTLENWAGLAEAIHKEGVKVLQSKTLTGG